MGSLADLLAVCYTFDGLVEDAHAFLAQVGELGQFIRWLVISIEPELEEED